MGDRLAEIEAASTQGHHEWWDRAHAMRDLRDLLAVAKAARNLNGAWAADGVEFRAAQDALRAALTDLGGGAA